MSCTLVLLIAQLLPGQRHASGGLDVGLLVLLAFRLSTEDAVAARLLLAQSQGSGCLGAGFLPLGESRFSDLDLGARHWALLRPRDC